MTPMQHDDPTLTTMLNEMHTEAQRATQTAVVHCQHAEYDVYIGRPKDRASMQHYGNPFTYKGGTKAAVILASRAACLAAFRAWLAGTAYIDLEQPRRQWILNTLEQLRGKRLGCWCAPDACHGDVYVDLLRQTRSDGSGQTKDVKTMSDTTRAANAAQRAPTLPERYQTVAPTHDAPTVREAGAVLIAAGIPKDKVSNILASLHSYDADKRRWAVAYCNGRIDVSEWHRAWGLSDFY